jgi:hypothetical protein
MFSTPARTNMSPESAGNSAHRDCTMTEEQRQWVLEIRGDLSDLNDSATIYTAEGDPRISEYDHGQGRPFFGMTSSQFSTLTEARQVHEVGLRLLGFVNGVLFIRDSRRKPLGLGAVRELAPNGGWNITVLVEASHFDFRPYPPTVTVSGEAPKVPPYLAWTSAANSDDCVAEVLMLLSREPDWFDLYSAFEKMRADINRRYGQHKQTGGKI